MLRTSISQSEKVMERMKSAGYKRLIVSYKDSAIGSGVLSFEDGKFIRLHTIKNDPRLTHSMPIRYESGLEILRNILEGKYALRNLILVKDEKQSAFELKMVVMEQ